MAGVGFKFDGEGIGPAAAALGRFGDPSAREELLEIAAVILEGGARERINDTKVAPDGTPWAPWSEAYEKTRENRHSLLVNENDLQESLGWEFGGGGAFVEIGASRVYAAIHQFGSAEEHRSDIPARPYLGMSDAEARDIEDAALARLSRMLEGR